MLRSSFATGLVTLAALATGCATVAGSAYNLDELHASDGRHKRAGVLLNPLEFAARQGVSGLFLSFGSKYADAEPESIDDPAETCVAELNQLREFDPRSTKVGSTQVEYFARIAVLDPWHLSRAIAVEELGRAGRRLELQREPLVVPEAPTATPEEVRQALEAAVSATSRAVATGDVQARGEFERAAEQLGELNLELEGGTRVLRSINILLRAAGDKDERLAPLRSASLRVQRKLVRVALESALVDAPPAGAGGSDPGWPHPRVQAAACRALVAVWGEPALRRLVTARPFNDREPLRLKALLGLVAERGLPEPEPPGNTTRVAWIDNIFQAATEHPDGSVRLAAMDALGKISGRGRFSLREEEWQTWWRSARPTLAAEGASGP